MYKKILVALENGRADESLLPHVAQLATLLGSELLLIHVADGWVARNYEQLKLAESDEMKADRAVPRAARPARSRSDGLRVERPPGAAAIRRRKSSRPPSSEQCDLIAMTTHGHRLLRRSDSRQHDHGRAAQEPDSDPAGARWCPGRADGLIAPGDPRFETGDHEPGGQELYGSRPKDLLTS